MFGDRLAEVDLNYQEASVEQDASNDGGDGHNSPVPRGKKSEVGDEQGDLEPEDTRDVTLGYGSAGVILLREVLVVKVVTDNGAPMYCNWLVDVWLASRTSLCHPEVMITYNTKVVIVFRR